MTDDERTAETEGGEGATQGAHEAEGSSDSRSSGGGSGSRSFADGVRQGIGVLGAFKDALEETIQEARDRGDLSSERARDVMKDALHKAQSAAEGARERLDFATQGQVDTLQEAVDALATRVSALEARVRGAWTGADGTAESETEDAAPKG
jgi:polyhydroxyalkanoate synthesis regulator phasin